eukprot:364797-Chlamydomonas_euryale.AAC.5
MHTCGNPTATNANLRQPNRHECQYAATQPPRMPTCGSPSATTYYAHWRVQRHQLCCVVIAADGWRLHQPGQEGGQHDTALTSLWHPLSAQPAATLPSPFPTTCAAQLTPAHPHTCCRASASCCDSADSSEFDAPRTLSAAAALLCAFDACDAISAADAASAADKRCTSCVALRMSSSRVHTRSCAHTTRSCVRVGQTGALAIISPLQTSHFGGRATRTDPGSCAGTVQT